VDAVLDLKRRGFACIFAARLFSSNLAYVDVLVVVLDKHWMGFACIFELLGNG